MSTIIQLCINYLKSRPIIFPIEMLREHKKRQDLERTDNDRWQMSGMVFTSTIGTPLSPETLMRHFKASLEQANLPKTIRFHDLRHSCATLKITRGIYPRVFPELQREAVNELDKLLEQPKTE